MTTATRHRMLQIGRMHLPALEAEMAARYDVTCLADQPDPAAYLAARGTEFTGVCLLYTSDAADE